jgi:DNA-binding response OmpR family regulator
MAMGFNQRIMIVDADLWNLRLCTSIASEMGFEVSVRYWGPEGAYGEPGAIARPEDKAANIYLISLDCGYACDSRIHELVRTTVSPIIFMSKSIERRSAWEAELGAMTFEFARIPINVKYLRTILEFCVTREPRADARIKPKSLPARSSNVEIDVKGRTVRSESGASANLTEREALLLGALVRAQGASVPREALARFGGTNSNDGIMRSVDVHLSNLRRKLREAKIVGLEIKSSRNKGYWLSMTN